ncbi:type II and III secretion system protein family protein [Paraburkholderia mimosarum]|uniref:type II and III secretion system protein family protein n=1 Tax=Paraburkholderia mimosarum TaxID=312026 RepID=UPI0039C3FC39
MLLFGLGVAAMHGAFAASIDRPSSGGDGITSSLSIAAGGGEMLRLPEPAVAVFVADPNVADVHVPSAQTVFVLGKKTGTTTLFALGPNSRTILRKTIIVGADTASLQRMLEARFPQFRLTVTGAPGSLMVSGQVPSAADADAVIQTLTPYLHNNETVVNRMTLTHPIQVNLRVRITEVDRNVTQQLGINWSALGSSGNFLGGLFSGNTAFSTATSIAGGLVTATGNASTANGSTSGAYSVLGGFHTAHMGIDGVLQALDQEGLVTMLAEPNLTAMSGETASFLAGGEFPIPVPQGMSNAITVEYKPYGVSLDFIPTVLTDNRISLKVRPEVSEIDTANSITTNGITVPALTVRRVDTTVELASGQSFAIGGLLQSNTSDVLSELPGLGTLPVLGKLFSSKKYLNNKSELVVIVTPYIVQPTDPGRLRQSIDSVTRPSTDIEYVLQNALGLDPLSDHRPRLVGAAGFVY